MSSSSTMIPLARLCHLRKRPDFVEFGFNLHTENNNNKFVHNVDADSPASVAGLKMLDRIIEVNGINISNENHGQVVERVKSREDQVQLLVVCAEADAHLRKNNINVTSNDKDILKLPVDDQRDNKNANADKEDEVEPNPPRLCELHLRDSKEYGFVLHCDNDREGQYIRDLDVCSPASESGLRNGDKLIEVNGKCVNGKGHSEVISMIKENPGVVKILVVDTKSEKVYRRQSIAISSSLQNILTMPPATDDKKNEDESDEECTLLPATTTEINNNTNKEDSSDDVEKPVEIKEEIIEMSSAVEVNSKPITTPLEEPLSDDEKETFSIPIIVKGVTTTVDLTEEERQQVIRENSQEDNPTSPEVSEVVEEVAAVSDTEIQPAEPVVAEASEPEEQSPEDDKVNDVSKEQTEEEVTKVEIVESNMTNIPIVTVDEVDNEQDKPQMVEIEEVASVVAAAVTNDAIQKLSNETHDDCTDAETGEPVPCPSGIVEENPPPPYEPESIEVSEPVEESSPIAEPTEQQADEPTEHQVDEPTEQQADEPTEQQADEPTITESSNQNADPVDRETENTDTKVESNEVKQVNGISDDTPVDDSPIEPVKKTVSRYDSTPTSPGSFSMSRTTAPVPAGDAEPAIFSMSVAEARKKLVGAKQAKDVRSLQLTPAAKVEIMKKL